MSRLAAFRRLFFLLGILAVECGGTGRLRAYEGPRGFDTVVIDAGHGGTDRGGGPGQAIPEKPYTLDAAIRLERALRLRGFRTVMTRSEDVFVSLPERVSIADRYPNAVFVSLHFNSAPREEAHGYETYYYRSDSFGLAARLHGAQLATLNTEDRHVRRRGFFVLRKPGIPAVLCEGGFLTNPDESRTVLESSYRQQWAENIADALVAQRREGDPAYLGAQPSVTTEHLVASGGGGVTRSYRHSHGSASGRRRAGGSSSRGSSSRSQSTSRRSSASSSHSHGKSSSSASTTHHRRHHASDN